VKRLQLYQDKASKWGFRTKSNTKNNLPEKVVTSSSQGYHNKEDMEHGAIVGALTVLSTLPGGQKYLKGYE
jgi:uncharacterized protein YegP (UPF0339 family)